MAVETNPSLTTEQIGQLTTLYLGNQEALFDARLDELGRGLTPLRRALREEHDVRHEMAQETAAAIRRGATLFNSNVIADLAVQVGLDPEQACNDRQLHGALAIAVTRHNQACADRLVSAPRTGFLSRLFGEADRSKAGVSCKIAAPDAGPTAAVVVSSLPMSAETVSSVPAAMAPCAPRVEMDHSPESFASAIQVVSKPDPIGQQTSSEALGSFDQVTTTKVERVCPIVRTAAEEVATPAGTAVRVAAASDTPYSPSGPQTGGDHDGKTVESATGQPGPVSIDGAITPSLNGPATVGDAKPLWDGRLSTIWPEFVASKLSTGEYKQSRAPELGSTYRIVTWIMGDDFSLAHSTETELAEFKRRYLLLPKNYKTLRLDHADGGRCRTYDELMLHVETRRKDGEQIPVIKPPTFNKHKSTLSTALEWSLAHRTAQHPVVNRIRALHIKGKKTAQAAKLERHMTPNNLLIALFRSFVWCGRLNVYHLCRPGQLIIRDSLYWVPLMMTGNGLRREEACQLRVRHIVNRFGIWCYDLLAEDIKVKSEEASPRLVAIQKEVLDAGIMEALVFGRHPDEQLFPELSDDNAHHSFGDAFGKRIANYVANVELDLDFLDEELLATIPVDAANRLEILARMKADLLAQYRDKFTNHGIRHWWKTYAINSGCHSSFVDDNLGHVGATRGEGARYLKEIWVQNLKKTVDQVPMPFSGADLKRRAEEALKLFETKQGNLDREALDVVPV